MVGNANIHFIFATSYAHTIFHLPAPDNELVAPGWPLIPDAPEPLYLSLSHSLRSTVQLSNGTNVLSCGAHSTAPPGSE